jgi:hypothetical protein
MLPPFARPSDHRRLDVQLPIIVQPIIERSFDMTIVPGRIFANINAEMLGNFARRTEAINI